MELAKHSDGLTDGPGKGSGKIASSIYANQTSLQSSWRLLSFTLFDCLFDCPVDRPFFSTVKWKKLSWKWCNSASDWLRIIKCLTWSFGCGESNSIFVYRELKLSCDKKKMKFRMYYSLFLFATWPWNKRSIADSWITWMHVPRMNPVWFLPVCTL